MVYRMVWVCLVRLCSVVCICIAIGVFGHFLSGGTEPYGRWFNRINGNHSIQGDYGDLRFAGGFGAANSNRFLLWLGVLMWVL